MRVLALFLFLWPLLVPMAATAEPDPACSSGKWGQVQCIRADHFVFDTCQALETFATRHALDPGFFARLIWQESRFDRNALSHADAMGIAQFIASTAARRGLTDPWNPALALEHSAEYLGDLTRRFGNMGLAAVAYNGGERRAEGLVAKTGGLARETVNYVQIITGLSAETWRDSPPEAHDFRLQPDKPFRQACYDLARDRRITAFPTPKPPKPRVKPWGVQLAFGTSKDKARAAYARKTQSCKALLKGEKPDLIHVQNRVSGRAGFYMARIGRDNRKAAGNLCSRLKAAGCVCTVYQND
ncbi:lytic transglycosylase domain-containing protein [Mesobacterium hydrothermale]|nr:lytic transglycosylase domain-containing protein [Mesobacterium sp. TK19101]